MIVPGPYLLFLGNIAERLDAKTALGLQHWRPELCAGQHRLSASAVDIGLPDMTPAQAAQAGARTLVVGVAPFGGDIAPEWRAVFLDAIDAGLNIASGMHRRLTSIEGLAERAASRGVSLFDVRHADATFSVASGRKRTGKRLLTVGVDCAVGKKYTALAIHKAMLEHGAKATFRATGQTGILIAGGGIAIDAVVSDFVAGAAEALSPDNVADHWDIIEGQGSLFHPAYAGVSLGLLHGSQPDAIVVCHEPGRVTIDGYPSYPLPTLEACIARHEEAARLTNPDAHCVGISLDTSRLSSAQRRQAIDDVARRTGLPVIDPIATGAGAIADTLFKPASLSRIA